MPKRLEDPSVFSRALNVLSQYYRTRVIKFLGGEPLLHPAIAELIRIAKKFPADRIRVVTNGALLVRFYRELIGANEIHVSLYPGMKQPTSTQLQEIAKSLKVEITLQHFDFFRHPRSREQSAQLTARIFATCQLYHRWQCHTLRDGWFFPCPPAATWGLRGLDGIDLLTAIDTAHALNSTLRRHIPFATCRRCLGSAGKLYPHTQDTLRNKREPSAGECDFGFLQALEATPDAHNGCYRYGDKFLPNGKVVQGRYPEEN